MQRRNFLTKSCKACLLGAAGYIVPQLTGCAPSMPVYKTAVNNNNINVPLTLFDKSTVQLIRPQGWYYDIAVRRKEDNTYSALLLQCTHQENQLTPTGNGYYCSLHGSTFDKDGNVKKGPAEQHLQEYTTTVGNNSLIIHIKNV